MVVCGLPKSSLMFDNLWNSSGSQCNESGVLFSVSLSFMQCSCCLVHCTLYVHRCSGSRVPDAVPVQSPVSGEPPPLSPRRRRGGHLDARDTPLKDVRMKTVLISVAHTFQMQSYGLYSTTPHM